MANKTLLDILPALKEAGFTEELRLHHLHLHALNQDLKLEVNDFTVAQAYRFEGSASDEDVSELYAIEAPQHGLKGFLIDELDGFRTLYANPLLEKLQEAEKALHVYDDSDQELKFGVPKVYKAKFNEDPERYELRKGFPDFPSCPYGNSFSMLGFDKKENRYVWLVSSIIKDERLAVNEYA